MGWISGLTLIDAWLGAAIAAAATMAAAVVIAARVHLRVRRAPSLVMITWGKPSRERCKPAVIVLALTWLAVEQKSQASCVKLHNTC